MKQLSWNIEEFKQFKKEYKTAIKHNKESFFFQEDEFLTSYAKYLIEYLEPRKIKAYHD